MRAQMNVPHKGLPAIDARGSMIRIQQIGVHRHFREPRFWVVQALVLLATALHASMETIESSATPQATYLFVVIMYGLYFVPVIYAGLYFGKEGAIPTAIWTSILAVPLIIFNHEGTERIAESLQLLIIIGLALVIANRVDREISARFAFEESVAAQLLSEARYHALFDEAGDAILVFDQFGNISETNAAATSLFGAPADHLRQRNLADLFGDDLADRLLAGASDGSGIVHDFHWKNAEGAEIWLGAVFTIVPSASSRVVYQAMFRDVTDRHAQQSGLEAFARQIVAAQEEERDRISHELHDGPLQNLILLCRRLDESAFAGQPNLDLRTSAAIQEARNSAEEIVDEVRRLSRDLRPSILDDLGLVPAVRWLVKDLEQRTDIRTRLLTPDSDRRIARDAELALFRIAQEALHNVERHARASEVVIVLRIDDQGARLTIKDDGRGMEIVDTSAGAAVSGKLGLLGMYERARLCGGQLAISSAPGQGTSVEALLSETG